MSEGNGRGGIGREGGGLGGRRTRGPGGGGADRILPADRGFAGHRATSIELLFDLVFVFAFSQISSFLVHRQSTAQLGQGLVILTLLWWVWAAYAALGNQARGDTAVVKMGFTAGMAAMFITALAIREAWSDAPGGLYAPLVFVYGIIANRVVYCLLAFHIADDDPQLLAYVRRSAVRMAVTSAALLVGAERAGTSQLVLWTLAAVADWLMPRLVPADRGWPVPNAAHFAERHGLILIIAIGELMISVGDGVSVNQEGRHVALSLPVIETGVYCIVLAVCLWWLYFDFVGPPAARRLSVLHGSDRTRFARRAYGLLHFLLIAGVVYIALGLEEVIDVLQRTPDHPDLHAPLPWSALVALYGGTCAYLAAGPAIQRLSTRAPSVLQLGAAVLCLAFLPVAHEVSALAALAFVAGLLVVLVSTEGLRRAHAGLEWW
ncbi:low temperature requirement protein A [Streptomyces sp. PTM05]|uniref:Low temperature requirement protein A n=1 Tax=Streptantibioticus parmotrematis TaxID=2873249 RepID=A0ABS7QK95_9ACTN|nr:low temperature requirement protein A [Streptantibioticus parmotrematis]MBY8883597.1 low temperature requirement protein A [Streptantibioticus parmotrematis]